MIITRRYTAEGQDPFITIPFAARTSRIINPDGSVVFEMKELQAPESWSQVAVDILAQKYFRRAGVPAKTERVGEAGVPEWLQRSRPAHGDAVTGHESLVLVTSATVEGERYAVRVVEAAGVVSARCTCPCGQHAKHVCWHIGAALIRLGLHTPAPLPMVADTQVVAAA